MCFVTGNVRHLWRSEAGIDPALAAVVPFGVGIHHAGLTVEERELIQDAFVAGVLQGVNALSSTC